MRLGPDYPSGPDRKLTANYRRKVCWNWESNPRPASCEAQVFLNANKQLNCLHLIKPYRNFYSDFDLAVI